MNFLVSAATGILSGFGVGGGTLLIIVMTNFLGVPQLAAQGINLLYFLPTAGASLFGHIKNKLIDFETFIWAVIPGVIVTAISSLLLSNIDTTPHKRIFGGFLLFIGVSEFFRKPKS